MKSKLLSSIYLLFIIPISNNIAQSDFKSLNNLKLSKNFPLVYIEESIENPKFIAKKAKIFEKEKKVASSVSRELISTESISESDKKYIYF